jgi:putative peptide zinc metalloprotease protein
MAERFFSDSWYRVAQARPSLRPGIAQERHIYGGQPWYVLRDRLTGKSHRLSPAAHLLIGRMDGRRDMDTLWREAVEALGEDAPSQDDALTLLAQLHAADLLRLPGAPDVAELLERRRKADSTLVKQNVLSPMSLRLPLVNPDRFLIATLPLVRWLIGPVGLLLWLALCAPALVMAAQSWPELTGNLSDRLLSGGNLALLVAVYPAVKAMHELAHGWVARAFGCEVPEMGLMFLVFFPVPYVDATAAAGLASKWQRAAVGAAGIMAELLLAALALYAWRVLEPGLARAVMFNVMAIGGLSTLLVNGNPLLRFDGYFVMSDLIEVPNLAQRASRFWGHLVERYAFRVPAMPDFTARPFERGVFLLYAPAAFIYRIFISLSIALFVASSYFVVGVLLGLWSLVMSLGKPVGSALWKVATGPRLRRVRGRAVALTGAGLLALGALAGLVPLPLSVASEGVVWLPETAQIRTRTAGFVEAAPVAAGSAVAPGTVVLRLGDPVFDAELAVLEAALAEARLRHDRMRVSDPARAGVTAIALEDAAARLAEAQARADRFGLRAETAGRFVPARPLADLARRWAAEGELIGHVLPAGGATGTVRAIVLQRDAELVRERLRGVTVAALAAPLAPLEARLLRAVPAGQFALPSPALGTAGGGAVPVDPSDAEGLTALSRVFQLELAAPALEAPFGARVLVRFVLEPEPLGWRLWRRARQLVLSQLDA